MLHKISTIVWLPLLLFTANCAAQNTLLWQISGKKLEKPVYLFGTIHLICETDFNIPPKVTKALAACDQLVFETNIFDSSAVKDILAAAMSDTLISQKLSPQLYARLDSSVQAQTGVALKEFDHYKISTLFAFATVMSVKCQTKQYETELRQIALQRNMHFGELETLAEQMDYFNKGFTDEYCLRQLLTTDQGVEFQQLAMAYQHEDMQLLYHIMQEDAAESADVTEWVVNKRNANWIERMPAIMDKGGVFFAVGAMHLLGPKGLITLLKKAGYTLTPVMQ